MSSSVDTRHAGLAAGSKRLRKSVALASHDAVSGVFTIAAGTFLDELAPNDVVTFSALTGGSGIVAGADYYLRGPRWTARGTTTFQVSVRPDGPLLTGGSNATAGQLTTGQLTTAADGVLSSNYVSQDSPAGR